MTLDVTKLPTIKAKPQRRRQFSWADLEAQGKAVPSHRGRSGRKPKVAPAPSEAPKVEPIRVSEVQAALAVLDILETLPKVTRRDVLLHAMRRYGVTT